MKKFGFGCMRLPMTDGSDGKVVDYEQFNRMIDTFMEAGFSYFDTAHGYLNGQSEIALHECLVKRYPRQSYTITDKLSTHFFKKSEEIRPLFEKQLQSTGVEYFDYYLMHAMNADFYQKYIDFGAFEIVKELKNEGKIKHIGISFHDKAAVLEKILSERPEIEVVQIQFNYADFDDPGIESYKCYQICEKYHKPVIIMEPVKGGGLVNLPNRAKELLNDYNPEVSIASYALRFCASFEQVFMVLSGMSNIEQMEDNLRTMSSFVPFSEKEYALVEQVKDILKHEDMIACTACQYCIVECPKRIAIPDVFADYNAKKQFNDWNSSYYYGVHTSGKGKASDCIKCGKCEKVCPQHLLIRDHLVQVSEMFEKN